MPHKRSVRGRVWHQEHLMVLYDAQETREIVATRRAQATFDALRAHWPAANEALIRPNGPAHKIGAYHWRMLHKNLGGRRNRSGRAKALV